MVNINISGIRIFIYNEELSNYVLFIQFFFVKDYKTLFDYIKMLRDIYVHLLRGYKYKFDFLLCIETDDGEEEFKWVEQTNDNFVQFLCIINERKEKSEEDSDNKEKEDSNNKEKEDSNNKEKEDSNNKEKEDSNNKEKEDSNNKEHNEKRELNDKEKELCEKNYTKEKLKGKKKNELLEIAEKLKIERWKNKHIKYNTIADIIDAILTN